MAISVCEGAIAGGREGRVSRFKHWREQKWTLLGRLSERGSVQEQVDHVAGEEGGEHLHTRASCQHGYGLSSGGG